MELSILRRTVDFRGDHAADIVIAYRYVPHETVEQLIERVQLATNTYAKGEVLEIRVIALDEEDGAG